MYCKYLVDFFEKILKKSLTRKGMYVIIIVVFKKLLTFYSGWSRITHVLRMRHPQENKISAFSSVGRAVDS